MAGNKHPFEVEVTDNSAFAAASIASTRYQMGVAPEIEHMATPQWSTRVFLKQFFYHTFCPFSTIFLYMFEPLPFIKNLGYYPELSGPFIFNYFVQLLVLFVDAMYLWGALSPETHPSGSNKLFLFEIISMNLAHVMRYVMIAVKYAYVLPDPWWHERLMTRELSQTERASLLLVPWANPSKETLERELKIAEQRVGERLRDHHFAFGKDTEKILMVNNGASSKVFNHAVHHVVGNDDKVSATGPQRHQSTDKVITINEPAKPFTHHNKVTTKVEPYHSDDDGNHTVPSSRPVSVSIDVESANGTRLNVNQKSALMYSTVNEDDDDHDIVFTPLSVYDFCEKMIISSSKITGKPTPVLLYAISFALFPNFYRIFEGTSVTHAVDVCIVIFTTMINFVMFNAILVFLFASYTDYKRRGLWEQGLSLLANDTLRDQTLIMLHKKHTLSPTEKFLRSMDLIPSIDLTIPSNIRSFMLIHELFRKVGAEFRARIEVYNTAVFGFILFVLVLLVGQVIAGAKVEAISLFYTFATVTPLAFLLSLMAAEGANCNGQALVQQHALLRIQSRIGHALSGMTRMRESVKARLTSAHMLINTAAKLIEKDDILDPVTIIGFRASGSTIGGGVGTFFTLVALIIQVISSS